MKNLIEYKQEKQRQNSYKEASRIQEGFALTACSQIGGMNKQYEGHLAVQDVLSKIDAMNRMFELCLKDGSAQESGSKIVSIINNLYDLASIKMAEAKKQSQSYMQKAAGISLEEPATEIEEPPISEPSVEKPPIEEPEISLEPESPDEEEPMFDKYSPSEEEPETGELEAPSDSVEAPEEINL